VSFVACYAAWLKARRGKRPSANQLAFEYRWLDSLLELKTVLRAGRWQPARTVSFVVSHPKTREIHAPDFADRIVHHLLVERLEKLYEPIFIHDSYANRKGRGSHAAVDRLQQFMRSRHGEAKPSGAGVTASHLLPQTAGCAITRDLASVVDSPSRMASSSISNVSEVRRRNGRGWYLQLDIHNYFNSINRHILYRMLCKRLEQCARRAELSGEHILALRSLCHKLLANKVTELVRDPVAAALVPPHKRLANAAPGCGLPVGNLTSQSGARPKVFRIFANVYLNALDQFVKHTLKCKHYVRYVDDFILLADDAEQLRLWQTQIDKFLADTLALKCKEAAVLQPLCQGIDFLGYRVFADHRRVRPRVVAHCRAKLQAWAARHVQNKKAIGAEAPPTGNEKFIRCFVGGASAPIGHSENDALAHLQAMLGSYWGHFAHAQSVRLRHALFEQFDWLKSLFVLHPGGQLSPRWVLQGVTFAGQVAALKAEWPQARCLIQKGNRWLLLSQPVGAASAAITTPSAERSIAAEAAPTGEYRANELSGFNEQALHRFTASLRRRGIAYVCANQTGWLRHGTRRREVQEWFSPNAVVS
jgi:hypothetical protein